MNAARTHQPAANCVRCGTGDVLPGAPNGFAELCLRCQEGSCMECGCLNDTDYDLCSECLDGAWAEQVERRMEGGAR
jgi:hypothetical protein